MCNGYPIHEAMTIQRGKPILNETRLNVEFFNLETPLTKIEEFRIPCRAFPRVYQTFLPT